jgi:hypothetical protein
LGFLYCFPNFLIQMLSSLLFWFSSFVIHKFQVCEISLILL